jgi:nucleoside-diphosphate-sugar epimerase
MNALLKKINQTMSPRPDQKVCCVAGGGGFIGGAVAKRLVDDGKYVIAVDWKAQEFYKDEKFCDEFKLLDLRTLVNCKKATEGCTEVYNLACDMGGMVSVSVLKTNDFTKLTVFLHRASYNLMKASCSTTIL